MSAFSINCVSRTVSENQSSYDTPSTNVTPSVAVTPSGSTNVSNHETSAILETNEDILQIFSKGRLVSNGVAIGDGNYVITIIDYVGNKYLPDGSFEVVTSKGEKLSAIIQVIDPRTSVTLLKLQNGKIAPVKLIKSSEIYDGEQIIVWGWCQSVNYRGDNQAIYGVPELEKILALAREPKSSPRRFDFIVPQREFLRQLPYGLDEESIITDMKGNILGIKGVQFSLFHSQGGFDSARVVAADSFLDLLSPDVAQQPWINGPISFSFYGEVRIEAPPNYSDYASAISQSLTKIGQPLTFEESQAIFKKWQSMDGLTAVYAFPINLEDSGGTTLAQARWLLIKWGIIQGERGKPAYLIYGDEFPTVLGGFELEGDIYSPIRNAAQNQYGF